MLFREAVFLPTTLGQYFVLLFLSAFAGAANAAFASGLGMLLALPPAVGPLWGVAAGLFALAYYLRLHHTKYP